MKKIFRFEKEVEKKTISARVEVELTADNNFTASGWLKVGRSEYGGQCLDEMNVYFNGDETFDTIYKMWKKHHLNDLHAGTVAQEEALEKAGYTGWANNYKECCDYLESIGLFDDNGYKFGHGWLKREIPEEDLNTIKKLLGD